MTPGIASGPQATDVDPSHDKLAVLQAEFPCFRISREQTCDRARYAVRSLHPGLNPHTVVTDDIAELQAALEPSRHAPCPRPHPAGQPPPARPALTPAS
jgi:hypothetical protein